MSEPLPELSSEVMDSLTTASTEDAPVNTDPAPAPATPEGEVAPAEGTPAAEESTDSFTRFDPNALPPELKPLAASLQGDYTRKMQEAAPWRRLGEELGVNDPAVIQQAVSLFTHLQDESNLRSFAETLYSEMGLGQPPATTEPQVAGMDDLDLDSSAFKPYDDKIAQLEARLDAALRQGEHERMMMAKAGEVARQEAYLAEANPHWQQDDWQAVYDLAPAFDGDLIQTANALESFASSRLAGYINGKTGVAETPGISSPVPRATAETPRDVSGEDDPDLRGAATAEAREYLRQFLAQSE